MRASWFAAAAMLCSIATAGPTYQPAVQVGTVASNAITEASGIAASRRNPGVLWTHNDSGDTARIFALATNGSLLGTYNFTGVNASDFEDIAVGPGPASNTSYVYVGDIGDNNTDKPSIHIHRLAEPAVSLTGGPVAVNVSVDSFTLRYPDGSHNAETLLSDPLNGDLYVVTKQSSIAHVYRAAFPQSISGTITLQLYATLSGDNIDHMTGGDISPDGSEIVIRNDSRAWQWTRTPGETLADAFNQTPQNISLHSEQQGEALGFAVTGLDGFYTTSEGNNPPIYFYAVVPEPISAGSIVISMLLVMPRRRRGL